MALPTRALRAERVGPVVDRGEVLEGHTRWAVYRLAHRGVDVLLPRAVDDQVLLGREVERADERFRERPI